MRKIYLIVFCLVAFLIGSLSSQSQTVQVNLESVATDLYIPWDLEHWGGDSLLFTQRSGEIIRLDIANSRLDTLHILPNVAELQHSGLMGMALHPAWPMTKEVFIAYAFYDAQFQVLVRLEKLAFDAGQDSLIPTLILIDSLSGAATTTGARMLTTPDNFVFLSTGDINLGTVSQDTTSLNGKILRLNLDGSIPADNPFPGSPVWTLGHRNPQGLALSDLGKLFSCEHGASANDEVNLIERGRNYGWPEVSGFCNGEPVCQSLNLQDPMRTWSPPVAPCGLAFVKGTQALSNGLLMAGLRGNALYWLALNNDQTSIISEEALIPSAIGRIRDVAVTDEGRIFVSTSNQEGANPPNVGDDQIFELFTSFVGVEGGINEKSWVKVGLSNHQLNLIHENKFAPNTHWGLYSFDGKEIREEFIPQGLSHFSTDLSKLPSGYFFVSISGPEGQFFQKLYLPSK